MYTKQQFAVTLLSLVIFAVSADKPKTGNQTKELSNQILYPYSKGRTLDPAPFSHLCGQCRQTKDR